MGHVENKVFIFEEKAPPPGAGMLLPFIYVNGANWDWQY